MKNKEEELHKQIGAVVRKYGGEQPPGDFTEKVMVRIEMEISKTAALHYRPLITVRLWIYVGLGVGLLLVGLLAGFLPSEFTGLEHINLAPLRLRSILPSLEGFNPPASVLYGTLALAVFIFLQIVMLNTRVGRGGYAPR